MKIELLVRKIFHPIVKKLSPLSVKFMTFFDDQAERPANQEIIIINKCTVTKALHIRSFSKEFFSHFTYFLAKKSKNSTDLNHPKSLKIQIKKYEFKSYLFYCVSA